MRNYFYDCLVNYEINHLLCIVIFCRFYIFVRILLNMTLFRSPRAYRLRFNLFFYNLIFYQAKYMDPIIPICLLLKV